VSRTDTTALPETPMNTLVLSLTLFVAAVVTAGSFTAWAWVILARVDADLRTLDGFEGMHFEI
jgi:hypothetical protein